MKRAFIQALVIPLLTLFGIVINAIFPPYSGSGQLPPDKKIVKDSFMSIEEAKRIIKTAEINAAIIQGMEAQKKRAKYTKPKKRKVNTVYYKQVDTVYKDRVIVKPVIIYKNTPFYGGREIKYLTFSEWRDSTGNKNEKLYRAYLIEKGVIK